MTVRRAFYQEEGDLCTLMRAHPHNVLLKQKTHNLADKPHRHTAALMYMYVHQVQKEHGDFSIPLGRRTGRKGTESCVCQHLKSGCL